MVPNINGRVNLHVKSELNTTRKYVDKGLISV